MRWTLYILYYTFIQCIPIISARNKSTSHRARHASIYTQRNFVCSKLREYYNCQGKIIPTWLLRNTQNHDVTAALVFLFQDRRWSATSATASTTRDAVTPSTPTASVRSTAVSSLVSSTSTTSSPRSAGKSLRKVSPYILRMQFLLIFYL